MFLDVWNHIEHAPSSSIVLPTLNIVNVNYDWHVWIRQNVATGWIGLTVTTRLRSQLQERERGISSVSSLWRKTGARIRVQIVKLFIMDVMSSAYHFVDNLLCMKYFLHSKLIWFNEWQFSCSVIMTKDASQIFKQHIKSNVYNFDDCVILSFVTGFILNYHNYKTLLTQPETFRYALQIVPKWIGAF